MNYRQHHLQMLFSIMNVQTGDEATYVRDG